MVGLDSLLGQKQVDEKEGIGAVGGCDAPSCPTGLTSALFRRQALAFGAMLRKTCKPTMDGFEGLSVEVLCQLKRLSLLLGFCAACFIFMNKAVQKAINNGLIVFFKRSKLLNHHFFLMG